jgi:RimJ/RimL family protein N-acetyltransferase
MVDWNGSAILETSRLLLRTFHADDLHQYAELNADPDVTRYLGGPLSSVESDEIAGWAQDVYEREGIGLLAVERRADGAFLGMCGLHHFHAYPDEVEVGWRLARMHWGNGYATEAATAWLDHGFGVLGLSRVISVAAPENERSIAVMRRLGMSFDHEAELEEGGEAFRAVVYSITAQTWMARRSPASG